MANLTLSEKATTTPWSIEWGTTFGQPANGTVVLNTKDKYIDRDISIKVPSTSLSGKFSSSDPVATASGSVTVPTITIAEDGSLFNDKTKFGVTTQKPSGTDGTHYVTINETHSVTKGSATHNASAQAKAVTFTNTAGWLNANTSAVTAYAGKTVTGAPKTEEIGASITDNFEAHYIPVVGTTISGGGLSTENYEGTPSVSMSISSRNGVTTGVTYSTTQPSSGKYITLAGSSGALSGSLTTTRAAITETNNAGIILAQAAVSKKSSDTISSTVTVNAGSQTGYISIPTGKCEHSGGNISGTASGSVTTTPIVTISESGSFTTATGYGITTTKPSGTDGTNYLTIDGGAVVSQDGVVTNTASLSRTAVTYTRTAGWIDATDGAVNAVSATTASATTGTTKVTPTITDNFEPYYVPIASHSISGGTPTVTGPTHTATVTLAKGDEADSTIKGATFTTGATNRGTYYVEIKGSTSDATKSGSVSITNVSATVSAGITKSDTKTKTFSDIGVSATITGDTKEGYITIPAGTIEVGNTDKSTAANGGYTKNTTATVPAQGYLYINAGYHPNTQISLATLIPDDTNYTNAGTAQIRYGYEAYDTDGKKLIGLIRDGYLGAAVPKLSDGTNNPKYNLISNSYYTTNNTGYGLIPGNTYVESDLYIIKGVGAADSDSASASLDTADTTVTSTNTVERNISKISGMFTAVDNKPTGSSDYYIKVNGSGGSKITTAGWMPTGALDAASATQYYKIKAATFSVSGGTVKSSAAGFVPANTTVGTLTTVSISGATVADTSKVTGTSVYRVQTKKSDGTASGGYIASSNVDVTIYQGDYTLS